VRAAAQSVGDVYGRGANSHSSGSKVPQRCNRATATESAIMVCASQRIVPARAILREINVAWLYLENCRLRGTVEAIG